MTSPSANTRVSSLSLPARRALAPGVLGYSAWLIPAMLILAGLGAYGLLNNNEGMYAEIGREMAEGGSWIIPHLNGVPYIEKPPLVYWLTAVAIAIAGEHEHVVRLVPALAGAATLATTGWFVARVANREQACIAVLVLGSMLGFVLMSRMVMLDMWLTAGVAAALCGGYLLMRDGSTRVAVGTGLALAIAVLAKGFIAVVVFGLVLLVYAAMLPRSLRTIALRRAASPALAIAFLALATPWHVAATLELDHFAWFYFINEHVLRFLGTREPHDYYSGPFWYYLPRLLAALLPWTAFLVGSRARRISLPQHPHLRRFLWAAAVVPLIFFSLSRAKANYYVVICLPPLAMLVASNIQRLMKEGRPVGFAVRAGLATAALCAAVFVADSHGLLESMPFAASSPAALVIASVLALYALAGALASARRWHLAVALVAMSIAPVLWFAVGQVREHESALSARALLDEHEERAAADTWIYADFENFSSLPFYSEGPVRVIDSRSNDLAFAQAAGFGKDLFVRSDAVPRDARGLVWFDRTRAVQLGETPLSSRLQHLGCSGRQCVAELQPVHP